MTMDSRKEKARKADKLDKIRQNIFSAKNEKYKKMWENILKKLEGKK